MIPQAVKPCGVGNHMTQGERIMEFYNTLLIELVAFSVAAKEFVGEFLYAPFGIQSSESVNSFTLYFVLGAAVYCVLRHRRSYGDVIRGRRKNEFGLMKPRH
jgi:hypothetical protein